MMRHTTEQITDVSCGTTAALVGIDQFLEHGTLTTVEDAHNTADMMYSVSPAVKMAVRYKDGKDTPRGFTEKSKEERISHVS